MQPTEQTSVNAGTSDCGVGGEDLEPTAVLPWSKFDHPDMAQATGDANSSLSNYNPWASASTPSAEVVQQPPHGSSSTQVGQSQSHSQMPRSSLPVEGQHIQLSPSQARGGYTRCLTSWLGGGGAEEVIPGSLKPSVERAAHQCPRTPDCLLGAEALFALSQPSIFETLQNARAPSTRMVY